MRLAFCNATRRWGGVKTWTVEFAAALKARGHDVFIYGREGAFIERAAAAGLEAFPVAFGCDFNPVSTAFFLRQFREKGVQAVLVNVGKDLSTAGLAGRMLGIPVVQRVGLPGDMRNSLGVRLTRALIRPHYLCPCKFIRDGMRRELPFIPLEETSVIYSAKTPRPDEPSSLNSPLRLLSISQVNANKGHAELAHVLAALKRRGLDFHWDVAGTGDFLEPLRALCGALAMEDSVTFHGFVQDVAPLLTAGDVFVLSSYTEGLPNTLLEAMACGLAPVARAVGGVPECWPDSLAGLLAPYAGWERAADWGTRPAEESPLYAPLERVLGASKGEILQWKGDARKQCAERFSLAVQAGALEDFFRARITEKKS